MKSSSKYQGLLVVIPTRNRAELAMNAIRSVISQPDFNVRVLVSDNSTMTQEAVLLEEFCARLDEPRLRYIKPPQPLPMPTHWDWVMQQALTLYEVNHFIYLTDRTIFKPGALHELAEIVALYPAQVVCYNNDTVIDYAHPIRLEQVAWSGQLFEIPSTRMLYLSSQIRFPNSLPKMLNCCAPRSLLETIYARYGNVFSSIAPDYNFCYRCLALVDTTLYYDKTCLISYALDRSNGVSHIRGAVTKDYADFLNQLKTSSPYFAAPFSEFRTARNTMVHEYCLVQQETGSNKFPPVNLRQYKTHLAQEVAQFENPQLKREMEALIVAHGFALRAKFTRLRSALALRSRLKSTLSRLGAIFTKRSRPDELTFSTTAEALDYAIKRPREQSPTATHLGDLIDAPSPLPGSTRPIS